MSRRPNEIQGAPARRAALKLVDAVFRRGETLDQAAHAATQGLLTHSDKALARALASEVLRWLADLDALIDGAMKKPLPDDAKARSVLRVMLAGWLRLETPPHAVVATGLPLLAGGPRRLAHGVFSTLVKRNAALPAAPTLPQAAREAGIDPAVPVVTLATAHPAKFPDAVERATGTRPPLPARVGDLFEREERCVELPGDYATIAAYIAEHATPAA
jgi:16S rRNA (cytosine967-C5)-methyltransferase